jgi:hypothetical protein
MARKRAEIIELDAKRVEELLRRAEERSFEAEDYPTIRLLVESYACLTSMLGDKNTSIARLRKLLFGASTEKTAAVVGQTESPASSDEPIAEGAAQQSAEGERKSPRKKGHGRNGADAYAGAEKFNVAHESLRAGDACPDCLEGTVYATEGRACWCGSWARLRWGPNCTNSRNSAATCAARSIRPKRQKAWDQKNTTPRPPA